MDVTNLTSYLDTISQRTTSIYGNDLANVTTTSADDDGTFDSIFNAAASLITNTNDYLQEAQEAEVAYATGELTSTHELAVIEQKASLSLQYTVAIKNQLLSAYKEIMNIQM